MRSIAEEEEEEQEEEGVDPAGGALAIFVARFAVLNWLSFCACSRACSK